jgi:Crp-like helix-turn-helix domain
MSVSSLPVIYSWSTPLSGTHSGRTGGLRCCPAGSQMHLAPSDKLFSPTAGGESPGMSAPADVGVLGDLIDLRDDLSRCEPLLARLPHPLPARIVDLAARKPAGDLIDRLDPDDASIMLLAGLVLAEVEAGRARTAWLIGAQDLVRPSAMRELALTADTRWRALTPSRIAVLDSEFEVRAARIPAVSKAPTALATRTSSWLFAKALILGSPSVEDRLLLLFALLGERWGRMTAEGVRLRLPLTHEILAHLCGVRRPSVTLALQALTAEGVLASRSRGVWLLRRAPTPGACHASCLPLYERAVGLR